MAPRDPDRRLTRWLRHEPGALPMDAAGWVPVGLVLARLGLDRPALEALVAANDKQRLQLDGDRIRCCQGHSTEGTPVTAEALEATWTPWAGVGPVWHGTHLGALAAIAREGLSPRARTHVHLAEAPDSRVGKRAQVDVLLAVDAGRLAVAGYPLWCAPNGVVLARRVPAAALVGARLVSRAAHAQVATVAAHWAILA